MMYRRTLLQRMKKACEEIKTFNASLTKNDLLNRNMVEYSAKIAKIAEKNRIDFEIVLDAAMKDLKERQGENA